MSPDARTPESPNGGGVLSSLPRHRPGRRTSRRSSSSGTAPPNGLAPRTPASPSRQRKTKAKGARGSIAGGRRSGGPPRAAAPAPLASGARPIAIPAQGFEMEDEARIGSAVDPPSRLELATSVIEMAGEGMEAVVKSSVSAASSALKRTLELIPKP